jgi:excinuclease UvrABC ATPase subunit
MHQQSPEPFVQPQLQLQTPLHNQQLLVYQQQHLQSPTSGSGRSPSRHKQLEIVVPMTKQRFKELTSKWEASIDECVGDNESCQSCDMNQAADDAQALTGSSKDLNELTAAAATAGIA